MVLARASPTLKMVRGLVAESPVPLPPQLLKSPTLHSGSLTALSAFNLVSLDPPNLHRSSP